MHISRVTVQGVPTQFDVLNHLEDLSAGEDCSVSALNVYWRTSFICSNEGDLIIPLPTPPSAHSSTDSATDLRDKILEEKSRATGKERQGTTRKRRRGSASSATQSGEQKFTVHIYYEIVRPRGGLRFTNNVVYTERQPMCGRMWIPSIDLPSETHTWSFEFWVPAAMLAVCSGDLVDQVTRADGTQRCCKYLVDQRVGVSDIGLAVGEFQVVADQLVSFATNFGLIEAKPELEHTTADPFLSKAVDFYEDLLGSFPASSYKQVFIPGMSTMDYSSSFWSLAIIDSSLLYGPGHIDPIFAIRRTIGLALARHWFGMWLRPQTWADNWLTEGLARYLEYQLYALIFGNNEAIYQARALSKEIIRETHQRIANKIPVHPLYCSNFVFPSQLVSKFHLDKAFLVILMLFKRLGEEQAKQTITKMLVKSQRPTEASAASELSSTSSSSSSNKKKRSSGDPRLMTTEKLFKIIRVVDRSSEIHFERQWVHGIHIPSFRTGFSYNKKKNHLEIAIRQDHPGADTHYFFGGVKLRISELESSYDYYMRFEDTYHLFEAPFHSRNRRNANRILIYSYINGQEVQIDQTPTEMPLLWLRLDTDFQWVLARKDVLQPEQLWQYQLLLDRDVVSQLEAIEGLSKTMSLQACQTLEEIVQDDMTFWRVRAAAARTMSKPICDAVPSIQPNLEKLLNYFRAQFFTASSDSATPSTTPLPNDFSDFSAYFLKMELIHSLATFAHASTIGSGPTEVLNFFSTLLRRNDNSKNPYSDQLYLSKILRSLSRMHTHTAEDAEFVVKQLRRYLAFERRVRSYRGCIGTACIKTLTDLSLRGQIALDLDTFWAYAASSYPEPMRAAALSALVAVLENRSFDPANREETELLLERLFFVINNETTHPRLSLVILARMRKLMSPSSPSTLRSELLLGLLWSLISSKTAAFNSDIRQAAYDLLLRLWPPLNPNGSATPVPEISKAMRARLRLPERNDSPRVIQQRAMESALPISMWDDHIRAIAASHEEGRKLDKRFLHLQRSEVQVKTVAPGRIQIVRSQQASSTDSPVRREPRPSALAATPPASSSPIAAKPSIPGSFKPKAKPITASPAPAPAPSPATTPTAGPIRLRLSSLAINSILHKSAGEEEPVLSTSPPAERAPSPRSDAATLAQANPGTPSRLRFLVSMPSLEAPKKG